MQLVVFDVAGTTVFDGDIVIDAVDDALKHCNVRVNRDAIRALMGVPKPVAIRTLLSRAAGALPTSTRRRANPQGIPGTGDRAVPHR